VLAHFQENTQQETDHSIGNLALLDEHTNRSYKNAVFAVKRHRLLEIDRAGIFVPLCTRNVFLKCYSPKADNLIFWSAADRDDYQNAIIETLVTFFARNVEDLV
jgi:sugar diacid utilization regulator